MTVRLKGITWDHPRGYQPLAENTARFTAAHPDIEVTWQRRSLRDFGVQPIEDLARQFDLLVIDHPFGGRAKTLGCLRDLRPLFPAEFHAMLEAESVGPSTRSYDYGGLWALPTDAACQVASYRADLLAGLGFEAPPATFEEVLSLGRAARKAGKWLTLPTCQTDSSCLVASVSANLGHPMQAVDDKMLDPAVFEATLGYLRQLVELSNPESRDWNPIQTYDAMVARDDLVYLPYAFGYTNYSRKGVEKPLTFANVAGPGPDPRAGAILGGAGCAISAECRDVEAAVTYLTWVHQPAHQAGDYVVHGGQPGLRTAWTSASANALCGDFFANTLETIDKAFLRPRFDGFIPAYEHMALLVHRWLKDGGDEKALITDANDTYARASEAAARQDS